MVQKKTSQDIFYYWFKLLVVALVILNMVDALTTMIGVQYVEGVSEGNALMAPLVENLYTFLFVKAIILSGLFLAALAYLLKIHHSFPKLWENEVGVTVCGLVVAFYMAVVVNNVLLILNLTVGL